MGECESDKNFRRSSDKIKYLGYARNQLKTRGVNERFHEMNEIREGKREVGVRENDQVTVWERNSAYAHARVCVCDFGCIVGSGGDKKTVRTVKKK